MNLLIDENIVDPYTKNQEQVQRIEPGLKRSNKKEVTEGGTKSLSYKLGRRFAQFSGIEERGNSSKQKNNISNQKQGSSNGQNTKMGRREFTFKKLFPAISFPAWIKFLAPLGLISCSDSENDKQFNPLERSASLKAPKPPRICTNISKLTTFDQVPTKNGTVSQIPSSKGSSLFMPHDTNKNTKLKILPGAYSNQERVQLVLDYKNGIISSGILLELKVFDKNGNVVPGEYDRVYIEDGSNLKVYEEDASGNEQAINLDFAFGVADDVDYEQVKGPSGSEYLGTCHFQGKDHYFIYIPINNFLDPGSSLLRIYTSNPLTAKKESEGKLVLELERDEISATMAKAIEDSYKKNKQGSD